MKVLVEFKLKAFDKLKKALYDMDCERDSDELCVQECFYIEDVIVNIREKVMVKKIDNYIFEVEINDKDFNLWCSALRGTGREKDSKLDNFKEAFYFNIPMSPEYILSCDIRNDIEIKIL